MEYAIDLKNEKRIVKFIGNMDVHGVHKIEKPLMDDIRKLEENTIIFDLSKVDFVSSAGLRVLVASLKIIQEKKAQLVLCGLKSSVKKVFDIVDMNSMFLIRDNLEEALS